MALAGQRYSAVAEYIIVPRLYIQMSRSLQKLAAIRELLCALQASIRDSVVRARERDARKFAAIAGVTAADTIYQVDRISEAAIMAWFEAHWPKAWPVQLVMEGIEEGEAVTFPRGLAPARTLFKCIIDPIDGTRNFMYDKRSAWILAAVAPQRGVRTNLRDIVVAAMTELPVSKQSVSDQVSGVRGRGRRGLVAERMDLRSGRARPLVLRPSTARDFQHGFASLARFFPEGKTLLARLEEDLWAELYSSSGVAPVIFDDQYISTGGQLYELLSGRDRMIGDLRPAAFMKLGLSSALVCHPYDICTAFLLEEAGGVIEQPEGRALAAPLDTVSPVAWIGYANPVLARRMRPVLRRLMRRHFE